MSTFISFILQISLIWIFSSEYYYFNIIKKGFIRFFFNFINPIIIDFFFLRVPISGYCALNLVNHRWSRGIPVIFLIILIIKV